MGEDEEKPESNLARIYARLYLGLDEKERKERKEEEERQKKREEKEFQKQVEESAQKTRDTLEALSSERWQEIVSDIEPMIAKLKKVKRDVQATQSDLKFWTKYFHEQVTEYINKRVEQTEKELSEKAEATFKFVEEVEEEFTEIVLKLAKKLGKEEQAKKILNESEKEE